MTPWTVACQAPLSVGSLGKNTGVGCHFLLQGSSWPRDRTEISCIAGRFFTIQATMIACQKAISLTTKAVIREVLKSWGVDNRKIKSKFLLWKCHLAHWRLTKLSKRMKDSGSWIPDSDISRHLKILGLAVFWCPIRVAPFWSSWILSGPIKSTLGLTAQGMFFWSMNVVFHLWVWWPEPYQPPRPHTTSIFSQCWISSILHHAQSKRSI